MIERGEAGTFDVECDGCGDVQQFDTDGDWTDLLEEMDDAGWTKDKSSGEWEHFCPTCSKEDDEDYADDYADLDFGDDDDEDDDDDDEDEDEDDE